MADRSAPSQDAPWLERFHAGEREVIEGCYRDHFRVVENAVGQVLRGADKETVIHEVFLQLMSRAELRRGFSGGGFSAWLATVARHQAIDFWRRHRIGGDRGANSRRKTITEQRRQERCGEHDAGGCNQRRAKVPGAPDSRGHHGRSFRHGPSATYHGMRQSGIGIAHDVANGGRGPGTPRGFRNRGGRVPSRRPRQMKCSSKDPGRFDLLSCPPAWWLARRGGRFDYGQRPWRPAL